MLGVGDGVAEFAVFIEAASEEVVEQAGAYLLEFRDHRFRVRNRLVQQPQKLPDGLLLSELGQPQRSIRDNIRRQPIAG